MALPSAEVTFISAASFCAKFGAAYTGTHDNNTTLGWWVDDANETERANAETYLQKINHPAEINWAMMRAAAARSVSESLHLPPSGHPASGQ